MFDFGSAIGGAATGFATPAGPWGALAGGLIGGFVGGAAKKKAKEAQQAQANNPDQAFLKKLLMDKASGKGPSQAVESMKSGIDQSLGSIRGGVEGISGLSQGAKARTYGAAASQAGRSLAGKGGELRAQEIGDAQKTLGSLLMGGETNAISRQRNQDIAYNEKDARSRKWLKAGGDALSVASMLKNKKKVG